MIVLFLPGVLSDGREVLSQPEQQSATGGGRGNIGFMGCRGFIAAGVSLAENSRLHCCRGFIGRKHLASLLQGFHRQKTAGFTAAGVSLIKQQASLLQGFY